MSTAALPPTPPSPGVGLRRKGPKALPRLPLSAFSPPNSGTSDRFPLPPSPSAVHPDSVIDAHVIVHDSDINLNEWKRQAGQVLGGRIGGVVISLQGAKDVEKAITELGSSNRSTPVVSLLVPFSLENPVPATPPYLSSSPVPTSLSTVFTKPTPQAEASLRWALQQGRPVDIDVQTVMTDAMLEGFEDLITKATADLPKVPPIILSNILPPPHELTLPIVKLMNHTTYRAFQSQTAALSLFPDVYIKFLPPSWDAPTPNTPPPGAVQQEQDSKQKKEWKRRIKMYLSPVLEAFGYERIIFGSSPSPASQGSSTAGDWYEIARESLTELGVEQDAVDAVFCNNAKKVYGV